MDTTGPVERRSARLAVPALAVASAVAVLISNVNGIAVGDDGVGYTAIADSLLAGNGLGYFLERPLTVWPPLWPALMAAISWLTPLSPSGAAVVLNIGVSVAAVFVANRLLRRIVADDRLVLLGTAVVALGSSTIGFGHLLMTDLAFAVVALLWMLALINHWESRRPAWLAGAAALVWCAFGLRYVAVVLIPTAALWLLLDGTRSFAKRFRDAALYCIGAALVPVAWMLRNRAADGTILGPRYPSARGVVDNGFDILATMGRFLLPGVANGLTRIWAAIGAIALVAAITVLVRLLREARADGERSVWSAATGWLGRPTGLVALQPVLYLVYILYIRSTTALNQLDLRLLEPAYLPFMVLALAVIARLRALPPVGESAWWRVGYASAHVWAAANVIAGLAAVVLFATGNPYFEGNYNADRFDRVRQNAALDELPADCTTVSNLPNALYPEVESVWSPRRTGAESNEPTDDLDRLVAELADRPTCLVWVDAAPRYGNLWTREQLQERVQLEPIATDGIVSVYEFTPKRG